MGIENRVGSGPSSGAVLLKTSQHLTRIPYGLGNLSAAPLLAHDGGACAARPGLIAENGEPPRTPSIYTTDTWSGRVWEAKYEGRDVKWKAR